MRFRIGVHVGDVIVEGSNLYGDSVNIAARLEALAEPGGVCLSGAVREQIGTRLPVAFTTLGEQRVKNIAEPVRAFKLDGPLGDRPPPTAAGIRRRAVRRRILAIAAAVIIIAAGAAWWLRPGRPRCRHSPIRRRGCRWSCCRSPISATIRSRNILPTASPTI